MGTWGPGPFDSDTAEDFLDELEEQSAPRRLAAVEKTFHSALGAAGTTNSAVLPEEVIVAAAVVAANTTAGDSTDWHEDYPSMTEWLAKPIPADLATSALRALDSALPPGGSFWRSWVDAGEREEARGEIDRVRSLLRPGGEEEPG
jgi:hypothetical protein